MIEEEVFIKTDEVKKPTEQFSVIFALFDGKDLELEVRNDDEDKYKGFTIIPGGKVEEKETYEWAMKREVWQEYGVVAQKFKELGTLRTVDDLGTIHYRHVFLVYKWCGELSNPEGNTHITTSLSNAREICKHPVSQQVLGLIEANLSR